jgi:PAS domain S-box-containing protein
LAGWFLTAVIAIPVIVAGIWLFVEAFLVSLPVGLLLFAALLAITGIGLLPIGFAAGAAGAVALALGARRLAQIDAQRRNAEQARAETETHLRQILDASPDAFVAIDSEGLIIDWNHAAEAMLGWARAEAIGRPLATTIIPEAERAGFLQALRASASNGDGPVIGRALQIAAVRRDGHEMPIDLSISPTPVDGGYAFQAFLRVAGDPRLAEEEAERSRTLLADLLDSAPDAVVIADENGRITLVNEQTERLFGYNRTELVGAPVETLLPRRVHKRHVRHRGGYLEAPGTRPMGVGIDLKGRRKNGTEFPVDISLSAISTDRGRLVTAFVRDITERKQTQDELAAAHERALEASRLKSEFVANMSHEIRTPLNGVMGMAGLLLGTDLSEEQREYAEAVSTSGDALMAVIEDILDFSKIEAGKLELMQDAFSLRERVEDACAMLAGTADQKGLELVAWVDDEIPDAVWGDGPRLRQILVNLLSNAVKFTSTGDVVTKVTGGIDATGRLALRFEVSDTGVGIDQAALGRIFESFSQADSSTTRSYGGTGLGLAISKRLVGLMGGEIGVDSEPGRGSTFWFTLPLSVVRSGGTARTRAHFGGVRALVVDDNATSREILERRLQAWGMDCQAVDGSGPALFALEEAAAQGNPFRIALLDAKMPGRDGVQLAADIRSDPNLEDVRLLLLASSGHERGRARQAGIESFLAKPVRDSRLLEELGRILGGSRPVPVQAEPATQGVEPTEHARRAVLVAEDNPVNQLVATRLLERRGLSVDHAADGREAVAKYLEGEYELIFMDCQMPELDGYHATAEIRRLEGPDRHPRIIAMTANTMKGDRERCLASGMDDYLGKPFNSDELDEVLARALPAHEGGPADEGEPAESAELPPLLDPAPLSEICERDRGLRDRLVTMFVERGATSVAELEAQLEASDLESVRKTAHTLKGSAAVLGARQVAEIAGRLSLAADAGRIDDAVADHRELAAAYAMTAEALTEIVTSPS